MHISSKQVTLPETIKYKDTQKVDLRGEFFWLSVMDEDFVL